MMKLPLLGSSWWLFKFTQLLNGELFIILSVIIYYHANILLILIIYLRLPILDENSIVRLRKQNNNVQDESKYSICFSVIHGCFLPPINTFFPVTNWYLWKAFVEVFLLSIPALLQLLYEIHSHVICSKTSLLWYRAR